MSINSCYQDISRYYELRIKLVNVVNGLNGTISCLSSIPNGIVANYSIDGNATPIANRTVNLSNDIVSTANYIARAVLPAIDVAINNKRREIYNLQVQQMQQQRRR